MTAQSVPDHTVDDVQVAALQVDQANGWTRSEKLRRFFATSDAAASAISAPEQSHETCPCPDCG